jgi:hypothetical protein
MSLRQDAKYSKFDEGAAWALNWVLGNQNQVAKRKYRAPIKPQQWSKLDTAMLISMANSHQPWLDISDKLGRTICACKGKYWFYKTRRAEAV